MDVDPPSSALTYTAVLNRSVCPRRRYCSSVRLHPPRHSPSLYKSTQGVVIECSACATVSKPNGVLISIYLSMMGSVYENRLYMTRQVAIPRAYFFLLSAFIPLDGFLPSSRVRTNFAKLLGGLNTPLLLARAMIGKI